jgi:hypothetical protein
VIVPVTEDDGEIDDDVVEIVEVPDDDVEWDIAGGIMTSGDV